MRCVAEMLMLFFSLAFGKTQPYLHLNKIIAKLEAGRIRQALAAPRRGCAQQQRYSDHFGNPAQGTALTHLTLRRVLSLRRVFKNRSEI